MLLSEVLYCIVLYCIFSFRTHLVCLAKMTSGETCSRAIVILKLLGRG